MTDSLLIIAIVLALIVLAYVIRIDHRQSRLERRWMRRRGASGKFEKGAP